MTADQSSDEELARAAHEGSPEAFSVLVERHHLKVFHFLHQITRDREEAEDLAQETFVRAFRKLGSYREQRGRFPSWLFTIARRLAIKAWRKRPPLQPLEPSITRQLVAGDAAPGDARDFSWVWQQARRALPADSFMVLWLFYQQELPLEEAALALGRSPGATKVLLHRSRRRLAAVIDADHARECLLPTRSNHPLSIA